MIYIPIAVNNGEVDAISREFFTSEEGVKNYIKEENIYNDFISCYKTTIKTL